MKPVAFFVVSASFAQDETKEFVEKYATPFIQTIPAKGLINDRHPNALARWTSWGSSRPDTHADILILMGTNYLYAPYFNHKILAIQIDLETNRIGHLLAIDLEIVADAKLALPLLNKCDQTVSKRPFLTACRENMQNWRMCMDAIVAKSHA